MIRQQCSIGSNDFQFYGCDFSAGWNAGGTLDYSGVRKKLNGLVPGIPGRYQGQNAALAVAAAERLDSAGTSISDVAIKQGIAGSYWPGRMELIPGTPPLLLDGAHNPAGSAALAEALADYPRNRILLVTGVCSDKDIERIYLPLLPLVERVYTVTPAVERALKDQELSSFFNTNGRVAKPCGTVVDGIRAARNEALQGDLILVCGSLFVVGEVKAWLENVNYTGIRG
jgi:dihydrofolate synthase/folylpolyglutamate synthase